MTHEIGKDRIFYALEDRILSIMDRILFIIDRILFVDDRIVYAKDCIFFARTVYFQGPFTLLFRTVYFTTYSANRINRTISKMKISFLESKVPLVWHGLRKRNIYMPLVWH